MPLSRGLTTTRYTYLQVTWATSQLRSRQSMNSTITTADNAALWSHRNIIAVTVSTVVADAATSHKWTPSKLVELRVLSSRNDATGLDRPSRPCQFLVTASEDLSKDAAGASPACGQQRGTVSAEAQSSSRLDFEWARWWIAGSVPLWRRRTRAGGDADKLCHNRWRVHGLKFIAVYSRWML